MKRAFPILAVLSVALLGFATYEGLFVAPTEQTMGDVQRIFYYHVPSAWTAFLFSFSISLHLFCIWFAEMISRIALQNGLPFLWVWWDVLPHL